MQRNTLLTLFATAVFGIVMANPVNAADSTWHGSEGTGWNDPDNWSRGVPGSGDTATIPDVANDPLIDSSVTVGTLIINTGAVVTVTGGFSPVTLTLDGTTAHDIDGDLVLSNGTAALKFSASVTVDGEGAIIGEHNGAKFQIEGGDTVTNEMSVQGQMAIETDGGSGNGTFLNGSTGIVLANADGEGSDAILLLASGLTIDDVSGAKWKAKSDSDSVLEFREAETGLEGNFFLDDCAMIRLVGNGVNITTNGDLTSDPSGDYSGTVDASGGGCFDWDGAGPPSRICDSTTSGDCT